MRLFVAVWPSKPVVGALRRMPRLDHPRLRWTTEKQWHVTLRFLGDVDDDRVDAVGDELEAQLVGVPAVVAVSERRARRYGPAAIGVPVGGLDGLAAAAGGRERFRGHITLARCRGQVPAGAMATGLPVLQWEVGEVALVRSHLDPAGARYETLRAFTLGR